MCRYRICAGSDADDSVLLEHDLPRAGFAAVDISEELVALFAGLGGSGALGSFESTVFSGVGSYKRPGKNLSLRRARLNSR